MDETHKYGVGETVVVGTGKGSTIEPRGGLGIIKKITIYEKTIIDYEEKKSFKRNRV